MAEGSNPPNSLLLPAALWLLTLFDDEGLKLPAGTMLGALLDDGSKSAKPPLAMVDEGIPKPPIPLLEVLAEGLKLPNPLSTLLDEGFKAPKPLWTLWDVGLKPSVAAAPPTPPDLLPPWFELALADG